VRTVAVVDAGTIPFGEQLALGLKGPLPMAFAESAASVDKLIEAEPITVGEALPVNPNRGLTANGHLTAATEAARGVERFEQADGVKVGLAPNIGGRTALSAVTIIEGPGGHR
jgi:acetyl-CoA C-acetyltransferase